MRTDEQISKIKSYIDDPYVVEDFLSEGEVNHLVSLYENDLDHNYQYQEKIKKNTGPVTLEINAFLSDLVVKKILLEIESKIGKFEITAGFFFKTDYPHIIHNDDTYELPSSVYKGITIPLKLYGENIKGFPCLCFFDQFYFHGPAKFFKNEDFAPTYYNKQIYEYEHIEGLTEKNFDSNTYYRYFTHLKYQWLEGLTLHSVQPWRPKDMIIFDSTRLHCASDFRQLGISSKLAISIFTKKI
jgi:hypothetical protein